MDVIEAEAMLQAKKNPDLEPTEIESIVDSQIQD